MILKPDFSIQFRTWALMQTSSQGFSLLILYIQSALVLFLYFTSYEHCYIHDMPTPTYLTWSIRVCSYAGWQNNSQRKGDIETPKNELSDQTWKTQGLMIENFTVLRHNIRSIISTDHNLKVTYFIDWLLIKEWVQEDELRDKLRLVRNGSGLEHDQPLSCVLRLLISCLLNISSVSIGSCFIYLTKYC